MSPSPPLTDPDVRISRIRFFACKFRSRAGVLMNDPGWRQGVAFEDGGEARPGQVALKTAPDEPFAPYPHELVVIPADPPAVAGAAVVGAVPPDHP